MADPILAAKNDKNEFFLLPQMSNRHGVITGATGTGKTVTLQRLAEGFPQRGVPVFMADIKGDLTGVTQPGGGNPKIDAGTSSSASADVRAVSGDRLGCFRKAGPSSAGDRFRDGAAADRASFAAERNAGRCADDRV